MTRIAIIGAGIAGLVLAQCLKRRQIAAIVFEKAKQFPPQQNFGITLFSQAYNPLLQALDVDKKALLDAAGIGAAQPQHEAPLRVNRPALLRHLAKDLDIRFDHRLTDLNTGHDGHKLVFSNLGGTEDKCDILIIADGVHSASRKSLKLDTTAFQFNVLPFIVYNGKRKFGLKQAPTGLTACLERVEGLNFKQGNILLQITAGYLDKDAQELAINYTLSRPARSDSDHELLRRSNDDAELLAKKFLEEAASLYDLPEPFKSVFHPRSMQEDRLLHWLMRSALIEEETSERLAKSNIALIGDASHPVPILGGAGANNAILDAIALADRIAKDGNVDVSGQYASWKQLKDQSEQGLHRMH